jgi:hypothetical protein
LFLFFAGFVSSKRRFTGALYFRPKPNCKQIDLAWPMCKYPLGSGGNENVICPVQNRLQGFLQ